MKIINSLILALFVSTNVNIAKAQQPITVNDIADAINTPQWESHLVLTPEMIPERAGLEVRGLYNPSVTWSEYYGYVMTFGMSIYCANGTVARDSIGIANSRDGINFSFMHYLIEPDVSVCTTPINEWPEGTIFQVNDPTTVMVKKDNKEYLYVAYTAAEKMPDINGVAQIDKAHIGTAIFEMRVGVVYRNDRYLSPSDGMYYDGVSAYGFSRPSYNLKPNAGSELWFDSHLGILKVPVTSVTQLDAANVVHTGFAGDNDIGVFTLGNYNILMTRGYSGLQWTVSPEDVASWSPLAPMTYASGEAWDAYQQAGGELFTHPETCKPFVYLAGIEALENNWYTGINIGVAIPSEDTLGQLHCQTIY